MRAQEGTASEPCAGVAASVTAAAGSRERRRSAAGLVVEDEDEEDSRRRRRHLLHEGRAPVGGEGAAHEGMGCGLGGASVGRVGGRPEDG
jgi:hypothetical protein